MQFGLDVPTTGAYADARVQAQLACEAEAAGWDGFFLWDTLLGAFAIIDPWIALTAIALHTSHIKIGLLALPLPRHRPWLVAGQLANLDQLSAGRVICTVGLGYSESIYTSFGEEGSAQVRAKKLDEGLQILTGLLVCFWVATLYFLRSLASCCARLFCLCSPGRASTRWLSMLEISGHDAPPVTLYT